MNKKTPSHSHSSSRPAKVVRKRAIQNSAKYQAFSKNVLVVTNRAFSKLSTYNIRATGNRAGLWPEAMETAWPNLNKTFGQLEGEKADL